MVYVSALTYTNVGRTRWIFGGHSPLKNIYQNFTINNFYSTAEEYRFIRFIRFGGRRKSFFGSPARFSPHAFLQYGTFPLNILQRGHELTMGMRLPNCTEDALLFHDHIPWLHSARSYNCAREAYALSILILWRFLQSDTGGQRLRVGIILEFTRMKNTDPSIRYFS